MQPPADKQPVRARLPPTARRPDGLWLTGQYFKRHPQLDGKPGYSLVTGHWYGKPFAGPYYEDRVIEWQPIEDTGQMSLFGLSGPLRKDTA